MPKSPIPSPLLPVRQVAPHVEGAFIRAAQAKLPAGICKHQPFIRIPSESSLTSRTPAAHVQAAHASIQAKIATDSSERRPAAYVQSTLASSRKPAGVSVAYTPTSPVRAGCRVGQAKISSLPPVQSSTRRVLQRAAAAVAAPAAATLGEEREKLNKVVGEARAVLNDMRGTKGISDFDFDMVSGAVSSIVALSMKIDSMQSVEEFRKAQRDLTKDPFFAGNWGKYTEYRDLFRTRKLKLEEGERKETEEDRLRNLIERTKAQTAVLASKTAKEYNRDGTPIKNMVCIVTDLSNGKSAEGRAGHGKDQHTLHRSVVAILPVMAANVHVAQTYGNCAEVDALDELLKAQPATLLKNLYFASAVPGTQKLVPPCANCKRWIKSKSAQAHGLVD